MRNDVLLNKGTRDNILRDLASNMIMRLESFSIWS